MDLLDVIGEIAPASERVTSGVQLESKQELDKVTSWHETAAV